MEKQKIIKFDSVALEALSLSDLYLLKDKVDSHMFKKVIEQRCELDTKVLIWYPINQINEEINERFNNLCVISEEYI